MNIWHKPDEKPIQRQWIVVKYHTPIKATCKYVDKDTYISPVCDYAYVNDLVQDYNRTRKALDVAVDAIKNVTKYLGNQEPLVDVMAMNLHTDLSKALEQITALEQKQPTFVHNKIEFPEYNDGLLEEFDKQFFENGQDDDLTETALEQKDVK